MLLDQIHRAATEAQWKASVQSDKVFPIFAFVKNAVFSLLSRLYADLDDEERALNADLQSTPASYFEGGESPSRRALRSAIAALYVAPDGQRGVRLVGPTGERPLLVCLLRAFSFPDDVCAGILEACRCFVLHRRERNAGDRDELNVAYGKDYVAAVAHLAWQGSANFPDADTAPPLWRAVCKSVRSLRAKWNKLPDTEDYKRRRAREDLERSALGGRYEGMSGLYLMIEQGRSDHAAYMVHWMLQHGARQVPPLASFRSCMVQRP